MKKYKQIQKIDVALRYFGHVMRQPFGSIEYSVTRGLVGGFKRRGRSKIYCVDNIIAWAGLSVTSLLHLTRDRQRWIAESHT